MQVTRNSRTPNNPQSKVFADGVDLLTLFLLFLFLFLKQAIVFEGNLRMIFSASDESWYAYSNGAVEGKKARYLSGQ